MLGKGIYSEFQKSKHSLFGLWHIILPIAAVVAVWLYYLGRKVSVEDEAATFYVMLSTAMPVGIAWMTALSVGWEEDNQFYFILSAPNRSKAIYDKLITLCLFNCVTIMIAVVFEHIFVIKDTRLVVLFLFGGIVTSVNLILYPLHLLLTFRFGKTVSLLTAFTGAIVGSLMQTGLGDQCWQWIPYSICGRVSQMVATLFYGNVAMNQRIIYASEIKKAVMGVLICFVIIQAGLLLWSRRWEGRSVTE